MYSTENRLSPKLPRIEIAKENPRQRKQFIPETEEERVAWAAKILRDFTKEKKKENLGKENFANEPKKDEITFWFDDYFLLEGTKHLLEINVIDQVGNTTTHNLTFYRKK